MFYTLENDYLKIVVSSIGATLVKFIDKKTNIDMILGFDKEEDYLNNKGFYFGSTVARNANRISNGEFNLNNKKYTLLKNNGSNNLHSGIGVSFEEFKLISNEKDYLTFNKLLEDHKDGFPGNLDFNVTYKLIDNKLEIKFEGMSDQDTIFNVTNHSYFNLNENKGNALNHELKINCDKVAIINDETLALDKVRDVTNTCFDFKKFRKISENLKIKDDNLSNGGIDHGFSLENLDYKHLLSIRNDLLNVDVYSDLPGVQIYTGNYLSKVMGKDNKKYDQYYGVAIEPQFYPNAINYNDFIKPILKANTKVTHIIDYVVNERK